LLHTIKIFILVDQTLFDRIKPFELEEGSLITLWSNIPQADNFEVKIREANFMMCAGDRREAEK
jgi:hypothetical protein